ncbi:MAG: hypothetical protein KJZ74_13515 [Gemmatimonadales bacterium]|nr:hypothetical protein [Gemmatimonadota bacterium]MCL4214921.1 hypothetical protein [Gemmatimonadales bacterium]
MAPDRRSFIKRAALGAAAAAAGTAGATGSAGAAASRVAPDASAAQRTTLDPALAMAVGEAVLPESIGAPARSAAVAAFLAWIGDYRPVSEEMHGYGDAEITYTPADPAPGWNAQLAALDLLSRAKHRTGIAALDLARRRALLTAQLSRLPGNRLPANPITAPHVALALMAHWAATSAATDLAYEARIGAGNCRVLAEVTRPPLPLAPGDSP